MDPGGHVPHGRRQLVSGGSAGVTIGSLIAATPVPPAPSPQLCWYWTSAAHTQGLLGLLRTISEAVYVNPFQVQVRPALNRRSFLAANVAAASLMAGCSALPRGPAVPAQDESQVTVLGLHDVRYWGDEVSPAMIADGLDL